MPSLLHIVDTDSLAKDPNLHFDPQNPSGHLNDTYPQFQELKEGLTPEQIEILENTTQVDGMEINEINGTPEEELIDPETGEALKLGDLEYTLNDLGFVDPQTIRRLTLEAFHNYAFQETQQRIMGAYGELSQLDSRLKHAGFVSRLQADNVNVLLGGGLYDNVIMESFTQLPTKTNFNLVLEEIDKGKAALAAGGAVVGAAILYKLIKWFLNSWNKNAVASGSIAGNIKNMQERSERLKNSSDIINKANNALKQTVTELQRSGDLKNEMAGFLKQIQNNSNVSTPQQAMELMDKLEKGMAIKALKPVYSNLWQSLSTGQQVSVGGGSFIANKAFFDSIPVAIGACKELQGIINSQIENINTTGADKAIQDKDSEYKTALNTFKSFGSIVGYNQQSERLKEYCSGLMNHILQNITAPLGDNFIIQNTPDVVRLQLINPAAWDNVNDDYEREIEEFKTRISKLTGEKGKGDMVNQGGTVQRDSRLNEYEKLSQAFIATMNVMRALLAIRNNLGKGLEALNRSQESIFGK